MILLPLPPSTMKTIDPEKLEKMPTAKLAEAVDEIQLELQKIEEKPVMQEYVELKAGQDACAAILRVRAVESGGFNSKFFQFQRVEVEKTDWKAICRHLVETKKCKSIDMEGAIEAFTEKKPQGKMLKMKQKDLSPKLS